MSVVRSTTIMLHSTVTVPETIFHGVARPARYTAHEWNSVYKPWDSVSLRFALCYPDTYEVGMSNLALHILYEALNSFHDILAERVFAPWPDMEQALRQGGHHLFSLESRRSLLEFDVIAFSLGYELTYTNVLTVLDLGGIPLCRCDRTQQHPIVIAGGSCAANPEPMSDFIDLYFIGEAEDGLNELTEVLRENKHDRPRLLRAAARLRGVYAPALYEPRYSSDGSYAGLEPRELESSRSISRRTVSILPPPPVRPVVPLVEIVHDYGCVEIQRGCTRGCRFCQAGMLYRPVRSRSHAQIYDACEQITANCGYSEISLLSLSSSDYPHIERLVQDLSLLCRRKNLSLSLPSLRPGPESVRLLAELPGHRGSSFTFAPEAGTERLRCAINKNVTEDDIFSTLEALREGGWTKLKLYFMIGLPTETEDDVAGIVSLVHRVASFDPGLRLNVGVALLVPKPHTSCQWHVQDDPSVVATKISLLKKGLRTDRVKLSWPDVRMSQIEAVLSRGDRRAGKLILRAWQLGSRFDAWGECFTYDNWRAAFESSDLRCEDVLMRTPAPGEPLPWAHIDTGISQDFLAAEYSRMLRAETTPDCRTGSCNECGLQQQLAHGCPGATTGT